MNAKNTSVWLASALAVTAAAWGCDERPKGLLRFSGAPTPVPPEGVLTHLVIGGPSSVPPEETAQFTVTAHYADATTRDVSGEAVSRSSDSSVLSLSTTGLATALERGEVTIGASFESRTATKPEVKFLPAGTFRLGGTVRDAGLILPNARVSVVSGSGTGLSTIAAEGQYRLYGVAGDVQIRASREGYQDAVRHMRVVADRQFLDFETDAGLSAAGDRRAGSFNGLIQTMDSSFRRVVSCRSPDHRFELTRAASVP